MTQFKKKLAKARRSVAAYDKKNGIKDRWLRTIQAALETGLKNPETNAHFEALVMLKDRAGEECYVRLFGPIAGKN